LLIGNKELRARQITGGPELQSVSCKKSDLAQSLTAVGHFPKSRCVGHNSVSEANFLFANNIGCIPPEALSGIGIVPSALVTAAARFSVVYPQFKLLCNLQSEPDGEQR